METKKWGKFLKPATLPRFINLINSHQVYLSEIIKLLSPNDKIFSTHALWFLDCGGYGFSCFGRTMGRINKAFFKNKFKKIAAKFWRKIFIS